MMDGLRPTQIESVFFDLDATLLALPDEVFAIEYPKLLVKHFIDLYTPEKFFEAFWKATEGILQHTDHNNLVLESFFIPFTDMTGLSRDEAWKRFLKFYTTDFAQLQNYVVNNNNEGVALVNYLKSKDIPLVLASNPVFPKVATEQRIKWAGLNWNDFQYITHGENSYSSKPDSKYYLDLAKLVDVEPENILMVGNSYYYDGFASKYGFKTFIYDRFASQQEFKEKTVIHGEGSLESLLNWFKS